MSLLAIVPARGGSKGIPRKNIRNLYGKPLLAWTLEAARQSGCVDRLIVSTEDTEIARVANAWGGETPFMRPPELAQDDTPAIATVLHVLSHLSGYEWVLLLQPTSPLRAPEDIAGILALCTARSASSAVSVTVSDIHPAWMYQRDRDERLAPLLEFPPIGRRQDLPPVFALNGALYLARCSWLMEQQRFIGPNTLGYLMPPERSVDVDTPLDWEWLEFLMSRGSQQQ